MTQVVGYLKRIYKSDTFMRKLISKLYYLLQRNSAKVKGENNSIERSEALLSKVTFDIVGNDNEIIIGVGARFSNVRIYIRGSNHKLLIGDNCIVRSGSFWFEDSNCTITVGDHCTIEEAGIAVTEPHSRIELGKDCMLSGGISIRNGDSHSIIDLNTNKRINYAQDIDIGDHVWIGSQVQILKGVKIGPNSIIGLRSIVTKDIPSNCIAVGVPAKVVKERVTWDRERIYE